MSPAMIAVVVVIALFLGGIAVLAWIDGRSGRNPFDGIMAVGVIFGVAAMLALGGIGWLVWYLAQHLRWVP